MKIEKNRSFNRTDKVASAVQQHVASILARDFSEGEIGRLSLSGASAAGGLQFVRLYYYLPETSNRERVARALLAATPKIRRELGRIMNQKFVPDIRFEYDDTLERANHIEQILKNLSSSKFPSRGGVRKARGGNE